MPDRLGAMIARAGILGALLVAAHATPASALSCVHHAFQEAGERFGSGHLVAHVEVLEVRAGRSMDVRVLRVLHGREAGPILSVDIQSALAWRTPTQWGFGPFTRGSRWVIVMLPAQEGRAAAWQLELCRAFLKAERDSAVGYVRDLSTRESIPIEALAASMAGAQSPAGSTSTR